MVRWEELCGLWKEVRLLTREAKMLEEDSSTYVARRRRGFLEVSRSTESQMQTKTTKGELWFEKMQGVTDVLDRVKRGAERLSRVDEATKKFHDILKPPNNYSAHCYNAIYYLTPLESPAIDLQTQLSSFPTSTSRD